MPPHRLIDGLALRALEAPDAPLLTHVHERRALSNRDAFQLALALRDQFTQQKLARKARVVLVTENTSAFLPLLAATAASSVVLVPIDPRLHEREVDAILDHADPAQILVDDAVLDTVRRVKKLASATRLEALLGGLALVSSSTSTDGAREASTEGALLIYTSGTTGKPKAVMLTERCLTSNARSLASAYALSPTDRILSILPYHHMNAAMITGCAPLVGGAEIVVGEIFGLTSAKFYWETVFEQRITICSLTPSIMSMLLRLYPEGTVADLRRVRFAFCGAAPLSAEVWRAFEERFGVRVHQGYGLTETTCWATSTRPGSSPTYDHVGLPLDCEVRIEPDSAGLEPEGKRTRPDGEASNGSDPPDSPVERFVRGEVLIRGPIVMAGYYKDAQLTKQLTSSDGYLRTGDLGYLDAEGCLHIVGRKKEVIKKNGIGILPEEIDEVMRMHPGIKESKTMGLNDDLVGETIVTACVLREGAERPTVRQLKDFARAHVAPFKVPDRIVFTGYLPKTSTGKIASKTLAEIVSGEAAKQRFERINTWKFKRTHSSDEGAILEAIRSSFLSGLPLRFVTYWGCGRRTVANEVDRGALARLGALLREVELLPHVRAELTLICTDVHARINGRQNHLWSSYYEAIKEASGPLGFSTVMLSDVWAEGGFDAGHPEHWKVPPAPKVDEATMQKFVAQAMRHADAADPASAARKYLAACAYDAAAVSRAYPGTIFLTYNGPEFDAFLPPLPKMYLHSYKNQSDKPWFIEAE